MNTPQQLPGEAPDIQPVHYWESYSGSVPAGPTFMMEVTDHRQSSGQITIDVASEEGNVDDIFSVSLEIARLPGTQTPAQAALLRFGNGELALTVFKVGDELRMFTERGTTVKAAHDPIGGSRIFVEE